jgi:tetraacyldisaccharide 4'-kinase
MIRYLLYPFAVIYDIVTTIRNRLYDTGKKPVATFDIPLIGVGNLTVGGTGKTPMIEYLIRLFNPPYKVAVLSRGYGRTTRGLRFASENDSASTIGDEPLQLFEKFKDKTSVTVCEERAFAIPNILDKFPDTNVILLDDAFQHRQVRPSFQILLTDYTRLFYDDLLLPAGRLRESSRGAARADAVIVTKCPKDLSEGDMMEIEQRIRSYTNRPTFFSSISYGVPMPINANRPIAKNVVLVSGIANAKPLETFVKEHYQMIDHFEFADHHKYSAENLRNIAERASRDSASVLTTEKDAVKLGHKEFRDIIKGVPVYYLPMEFEFMKNGEEFDMMMLDLLKEGNSKKTLPS